MTRYIAVSHLSFIILFDFVILIMSDDSISFMHNIIQGFFWGGRRGMNNVYTAYVHVREARNRKLLFIIYKV